MNNDISDPAVYAAWCDASWAGVVWSAHDDAPPEPEAEDEGPLDFSGGEALEIRFDSQGHWLQSCLNRLLGAGLTVDGAAGNRTRVAVKEFQRRVATFVPGTAALTADGVAGPATVAALEAATRTWSPDHGAVAAPVQYGPVAVTRLRGPGIHVRVAADEQAIELAFVARERRGRGGQTLTDPDNCRIPAPALELAALQALGLARGEAVVLRASCAMGPAQLDTSGPELVALGPGFAGRGGGIAAVIAAIKEDAAARPVYERLIAPSGLDVAFANYQRLDPATGETIEREGFELVSTEDTQVSRGDLAWATLRAAPHRLGALALAFADPRTHRVQLQVWRVDVLGRALRCPVTGPLQLGHLLRSELGVAAALLLARRGYMALQTWLKEQVDALAGLAPTVDARTPEGWDGAPALEAGLLAALLARLTAEEVAGLAGLSRECGSFLADAPLAAVAPSAAGPMQTGRTPPTGGGYVERRVKVSTYGTLPERSSLLVPVPAASPGAKRLHGVAAQSLARMAAAVQGELGIELKIASAWRAHRWTSRAQYEAVLVQRFGSIAEGKRWLGFDSPHETGLAVDFGVGGLWPSRSTAEAQRRQPLHRWLMARAWEFGWHPYKTEPWHWEHPLSLEAFKSGKLAADDPGAPEDAMSFSTEEDEEEALEDSDLDELGDEAQPT